MKPRIFSTALVSLLAPLCAVAITAAAEEEKQGWNPDTKFPALPPAEALKTIQVPAGFHLQCIARPTSGSSPLIPPPRARRSCAAP